MSRPSKLRLILADDHPVLREGLSLILGTVADMAVVAQASTGEEAFELFLKLEPDVLILDLQMPGEGGVSTVKRLLKKRPGAKILILTTYKPRGSTRHARMRSESGGENEEKRAPDYGALQGKSP